MKIVCIGDSITYGYGVSNTKNWFYKINNSSRHEFINKGMNGDTTTGILFRFYEDVIQQKPDICLITAGVNDLLTGVNLRSIYKNLELLIKDSLDNSITPVLGITYKINADMAQKLWSSTPDYKKINNQIRDLRNFIVSTSNKNNLEYIDFYSQINKHQCTEDNKEIFHDGLHLNEAGHELLYECVEKTLK